MRISDSSSDVCSSDLRMTPLLAARALAFSRNEQRVFGPLDFAVDSGEPLLVQGGNGAGKTTLLRVLAGLLHAEEGTVEIEGRPADSSLRARAIAFLGHSPALKADPTALANPAFLGGIPGRSTKE